MNYFIKLLLTNHNEIMAKFDKISGYSYPEAVQPPGYHTRRLLNLQVLLPEGCTKVSRRLPEGCKQVSLPGGCKYFCEYLCGNKIFFENILGASSRAYVLLIHENNQS